MSNDALQDIADLCDTVGMNLNESEILGNLLNAYAADAIDELINEKAYNASIDGIATSIIDADGAIQYADKLRGKS